MKRKIGIIFLALLLFTSCNKNAKVNPEVDEKDPAIVASEENNELTESEETPNTDEEVTENEEEPETDNTDDIPEASTTVKEEVEILEKNSDYISVIKMSQTGALGKEIHVLEDLKGSIKSIVVPDIPNIEPNYNYLVFLIDSESGDITLTDIERGLIKLDGDNDEYLVAIKDLLYTPEEDKKD